MPEAVLSWVDTGDSLTFDFYSYSLHADSSIWTFNDLSSGANNWAYTANAIHRFSNIGVYTVSLIVFNNCGSNTAWANVVVHKPISGINELADGMKLFVYPNPATDNLNIDFDMTKSARLTISLCDALGQKLYMEDLNYDKGKHHKEIGVADIPTGIYFLKIETNSGTIIRKIVRD